MTQFHNISTFEEVGGRQRTKEPAAVWEVVTLL